MNSVDKFSFDFSPPWWATLALLPLLAVTGYAGLWQLDRAAEKRALFESFDSVDAESFLDEPIANEAAASLRYRRIKLYGRFDPDHQILLDSMTHAGQSGYQVLTPLHTGGKVVLVNRGWIRADADRRILPEARIAADPRTVRARVDLLPRPGLRIPSVPMDDTAAWPRRLLYPTAGEIGDQLGYAIMDYQLLLDPNEADGFVREWRPTVMRPQRHTAYAVQWFALAATLIAIYIAVNLRRRR